MPVPRYLSCLRLPILGIGVFNGHVRMNKYDRKIYIPATVAGPFLALDFFLGLLAVWQSFDPE
jgi:hypothetical protein